MSEIVSFEIAKKLKEKGFKEKCTKHYYPNSNDWFLSPTPECGNYSSYLDAPTISQVLKWLREKDIMVEIPIGLRDDGIWQFTFRIQTKEFYERAIKEDYNSYEEAVMACLEYIINNLI